MQIRDAVPGDLAAIGALVQRAYRGDAARVGWSHEADLLAGSRIDDITLAALIATRVILIAEHAGIVRGCVQLSTSNAIATLGLLAVDPDAQAKGVGRMLIDAAERRARSAGATRIEMTVIATRTELIAYYIRRGYRANGERRDFPMADARFGTPLVDDLSFVVLDKIIG